jgi:hypothetical protein
MRLWWREAAKEERKEEKRKESEKYDQRMRERKKRPNITVHAKEPTVLRIKCGNYFHYHTVRKGERTKK